MRADLDALPLERESGLDCASKRDRGTALRLQTIVARQIATSDAAVVTVSALQAGAHRAIRTCGVVRSAEEILKAGEPTSCNAR